MHEFIRIRIAVLTQYSERQLDGCKDGTIVGCMLRMAAETLA